VTEPFKRIDHMVFNVRDLDAAVAFYTDVVGMKVTLRFEDRRMAFLSFGERFADIRLFEVAEDREPDRRWHGFNHVAFMPEGGRPALEELHRRLEGKGVAIETVETFAGGRHKGVYFRDPDNNRLEFYAEDTSWVLESRGKTAAAFAGRAPRPAEMPAIDLYSWSTSNGLKASIALEVMEIPYRLTPIPLGPGKPRPDAFGEASVTGRIPAIVDNDRGLAICESGAILIYLAEKVASPLLPVEPVARAHVLQWLFAVSSTFNPVMTEGRFYLHMNPGKSPLSEERVRAGIARAYTTLEKELAKEPHLAGEAMSIADIALFPYVARFATHGADITEYPAVLAWYRRLAEMPAVRRGFDMLGEGETPPMP
jgi:GST-like protein